MHSHMCRHTHIHPPIRTHAKAHACTHPRTHTLSHSQGFGFIPSMAALHPQEWHSKYLTIGPGMWQQQWLMAHDSHGWVLCHTALWGIVGIRQAPRHTDTSHHCRRTVISGSLPLECGLIVCAVTSKVTHIHSDNKVQHYLQESEMALQVVLPQPSSLATKQLSVENRHLHGSQAWCGEFARWELHFMSQGALRHGWHRVAGMLVQAEGAKDWKTRPWLTPCTRGCQVPPQGRRKSPFTQRFPDLGWSSGGWRAETLTQRFHFRVQPLVAAVPIGMDLRLDSWNLKLSKCSLSLTFAVFLCFQKDVVTVYIKSKGWFKNKSHSKRNHPLFWENIYLILDGR